MSLRENVSVTTPYGTRRGTLLMGHYGMPEIEVAHHLGSLWPDDYYTPGSFPSGWSISSITCGELYTAWRDIEAVMDRLRNAQREADADDRDRAQQREQDARLAQEIDERRCDEA